MKDQELAQRLMATFLEELHMHVSTIGRELLALEKNPTAGERAECWKTICRAVHTLKGASAVVNIEGIRSACHSLEDIFGGYRDSQRALSEEMTSTLLKAIDAIEETGMRLRAEQDLEDSPLNKLLPELQRLAAVELSGGSANDHSSTQEPVTKKAKRQQLVTAATGEERKSATARVGSNERVGAMPEQTAWIRVPAQKLDALLSHSGELLVTRGRFAFRALEAAAIHEMATELRGLWRESEKSFRELAEASNNHSGSSKLPQRAASLAEQASSKLATLTTRLDTLTSQMEADNRALQQTCDLLDDDVYRARMLPFSDACRGLERAVRDIATTTNKEVALVIEGSDVEMDRSVLEGLKDPLLHLVRNAVDHGIESPKLRQAAGKPPRGTVTVSAEFRGGQVEVRVEDDGSGVDVQRVCDIARKRGVDIPDDPRQQVRLIFVPGFSTAKLITDISGRGVGLDVVQSQVESLHGAVDISFKPGKGTRFTLTVPLTLTTIRCMLVAVGDQKFAIPTTAVQWLVRFGTDEVKSSAGRDSLLLGDSPTALVSLAATLGLPTKGLLASKSTKRLAIVLKAGEQRVAVAVDEVSSEQEVLVKSLGSRIRRLRHFSGCTLLPTGQIALVLNSANVVRTALGLTSRFDSLTRSLTAPPSQKSILLAEDSVTTRVLLKNILKAADYVVVTASDGKEAWDLIQEQPFDIVVTDVDMPRMNGFDLTAMIRNSEQHHELPVVLVTARGTDDDKQKGVQVGANAYIVKDTSFEQQNLLDTCAQLV